MKENTLMDELEKPKIIEKIIVAVFKKVVTVIIGGLSGYIISLIISDILIILYNDYTNVNYYQPSYVFVSSVLGCIIGLLPISVLKRIKFIQRVRLIWAIIIILLTFTLYISIVYFTTHYLFF